MLVSKRELSRLCFSGNKKPARRSEPVLAKPSFNLSKRRLALPPEYLNGGCTAEIAGKLTASLSGRKS